MDRKEMIDILNGMCERCLMKGVITTLNEAKSMCEVFDRFSKNNYENDGEYTEDILYLYNLASVLHNGGHTSLGESYSIYNAILTADNIDFVESNKPIEESFNEIKAVKLKNNRNKDN
jgi:hypothetical protein